MKKKSLASLEIAAIVTELQFLINGKVSQIYHQNREILLQLHAAGQGKQLLKIVPGKLLCLTNDKNAPLRPSGFCMQLRKYLDNAFIKGIYQKHSERIVVFEFEKTDDFYLIIELFSKGNVVLTDKNLVIIGALEHHVWKDRIVKTNETYIFPKAENGWKELTKEDLDLVFKKSDRKNLATCLATQTGLGGVYAEEVCRRVGVDKNKLPKELTAKEILLIFSEIRELLRLIENSKGYLYEEQITPFPLTEEKLLGTTKTYNEAVALLRPLELTSPYEKKIHTLKRTIDEQERAIETLKDKILLNKRKGEVIYEKYVPLQKLLDIVHKLKETKTWAEIASELQKEKKIKLVNLKNKTTTIDLQ
ncbi:MAG TPA: NFACT family protein [Candidatus Nanoarchaeia archaeon]|nr:NFACT family protein [Candidatus Nanoarchaeia archaeon]